MNWAPEALRAEIDYRVERATGDSRTTLQHLRAAQEAHPSWWRRHRANHHDTHHDTHHDEQGHSRAA